jgi:hypothetical protein
MSLRVHSKQDEAEDAPAAAPQAAPAAPEAALEDCGILYIFRVIHL